MTERTVTIQTEEEQTISLCDHCGLSDGEGEIVEYIPKRDDAGLGKMDSAVNVEWGEYERLHLHRNCLDDMGVEVPDKPTISETALSEQSDLRGPIVAIPQMGLLMAVAGIVMIAVGAYDHAWVLVGAGVLLHILVFAIGVHQANQTLEDMRQ